MKKITERIKEKVLLFDGAMGTGILQRQLTEKDYDNHDGCHEYLNISCPEIIAEIHESYYSAGCDIIETNSFGASAITLSEHNLSYKTYEINRKAAEIANEVKTAFSTPVFPRYVSGSIGPGSKLPTLGHADFYTLRNSYIEQVSGLVDGGVDLIQIETCQDLLQIKAALDATFSVLHKKDVQLPVIVQVTIETNQTMLTGSSVSTVIAALQHYPLFALGLNCGTGPVPMLDHIRTLQEYSPFYISVLPNAGMPQFVNGEAVYSMTPDFFADQIDTFVNTLGVELVGGCCGTTPEFIAEVAERIDGKMPYRKKGEGFIACCSLYRLQDIDVYPKPLIIGERTNATGGKAFREALKNEDFDTVLAVALQQQEEGAHLIDLSVSITGRNELDDIARIVPRFNREIHTPLVIDSTDPDVIECALSMYGGSALINSINLEDGGEKARKIIALAKRFGARVIALTIDEEGMAKTALRKLAIAKRIIELAKKEGLCLNCLFIDTLTFTLGSGDDSLRSSAIETLNAITQLKKEIPEIFTLLGVSNVSYGLSGKARKILNSVFLFEAVNAGLDAAIFHAGKVLPVHAIPDKTMQITKQLIYNKNEQGDPLENFIKHFSDNNLNIFNENSDDADLSPEDRLQHMIISGKGAEIGTVIEILLQSYHAVDIVNKLLLPAMQKVGTFFSEGSIQLPFVLRSAETMKKAVTILEPHLKSSDVPQKGSVLLATVRGDVHDIGKNLVDIILSSNGYKIFNIGIDCHSAKIVEAVKQHNPDYVGLSALLVKSTAEMKNVLHSFNENHISKPVICGGAALTPEYVTEDLMPVYNHTVKYAGNAFDAINIIENKETYHEQRTKTKTHIKKSVSDPVVPENALSVPFTGCEIVEQIPLEEVFECLQLKHLFSVVWQIKDQNLAESTYKEIKKRLINDRLIVPKASYGFFPIHKKHEILTVTSKEHTFNIETMRGNNGISPADAYAENDYITLFLVTIGSHASAENTKLFQDNEYEDYYLYHGISIQLAEALVQWLEKHIVSKILKKGGKVMRYSPGYPLWPELSVQSDLLKILQADRIGVTHTENYQLLPEQSVTGMITFP